MRVSALPPVNHAHTGFARGAGGDARTADAPGPRRGRRRSRRLRGAQRSPSGCAAPLAARDAPPPALRFECGTARPVRDRDRPSRSRLATRRSSSSTAARQRRVLSPAARGRLPVASARRERRGASAAATRAATCARHCRRTRAGEEAGDAAQIAAPQSCHSRWPIERAREQSDQRRHGCDSSDHARHLRTRSASTVACKPSSVTRSGGTGGAGHQRDARIDAAPAAHRLAVVRAAEEASPQAGERHRHDGNGRRRDHLLHAGPERIQLAGLGQLALGKDADDLAGLERLRRLGERAILHLRVLLGGRDRDRAHRAEDERQQRNAEDAVVHHEADRAAHARGDDDRVDVAHVVADDDAGAFLRECSPGPTCRPDRTCG